MKSLYISSHGQHIAVLRLEGETRMWVGVGKGWGEKTLRARHDYITDHSKYIQQCDYCCDYCCFVVLSGGSLSSEPVDLLHYSSTISIIWCDFERFQFLGMIVLDGLSHSLVSCGRSYVLSHAVTTYCCMSGLLNCIHLPRPSIEPEVHLLALSVVELRDLIM